MTTSPRDHDDGPRAEAAADAESEAPGDPTIEKRRRVVDGTRLQQIAEQVAAGLPAVSCTWPFGPEHDVFKVGGRIFLLTTEAPGEPIVTLKCEPPHAAALRQEFPTITPGHHMNKQHWISLAAGPGITPELVEELVLNAYELVVEGLPRSERPVLRHHRTGGHP
ncbi:MmcQ/YjbR family DNA-binding protein [Kocuria sp. CH-021]|uniref:MmcQ/YjbR family DNA-binding protein n=1 Tax=Kocuria sp. CH-021 TaxID=3406735 RepID=UPI003C70729F